MDRTVLEILVDRNNEKWPWVFEHVLIVLHKVYDDFPKNFMVCKEKYQSTFICSRNYKNLK